MVLDIKKKGDLKMRNKTETVKQYLGAMKVEERENGYYIRFRKSKTNKILVDEYYEISKLEDDDTVRLSDYELLITETEFERIYQIYISKLYAREV